VVCDECCVDETVVLLFDQLGQKCDVPGLNYTIRYISGLAPPLADDNGSNGVQRQSNVANLGTCC